MPLELIYISMALPSGEDKHIIRASNEIHYPLDNLILHFEVVARVISISRSLINDMRKNLALFYPLVMLVF